VTARICNDVNLGCNVWMHFLGYMGFDPNDNATRIIGYEDGTGRHPPFLKYFFYKFIGNTMLPECIIRRCTNNYPNNTYFQDMRLTWGNRPPINAVAGKNPDGSWVLHVVNTTNLSNPQQIYLPNTLCNIVWHVDELADSGVVHFTRYQSDIYQVGQKMDRVDMIDGNIPVTLYAWHMMTLISDPSTGVVERESAKGAVYNVAYNTATRQLSFTVAGSSHAQIPVHCAVYSLEGKKISTLVNGTLQAGQHTVSLSGKNRLTPGVYLVNLKIGTQQHSVKIVM
jgi:hypothetical protein